MKERPRSIAVVVAAYNAEDTIQAAVLSALAEPEVAEVVVVDDGSADRTGQAAKACDDGAGRLRVVRQENAGPSQARNLGVKLTSAPLWCLLDADDAFVPGRFGRLFDRVGADWDMAADGLEFRFPDGGRHLLEPDIEDATTISFAGFVRGNISRRKAPRTELGYLQPVMRRAFFEEHGLAFDPTLRFAEDYALYARALAAGARFRWARGAGYIANVRQGSLSHSPTVSDFDAIIAIDRALLSGSRGADRRALLGHMHMMRLKAQYLGVETALADGDWRRALRLALRDHHMAGFTFNHRYRARVSRAAKRWLRWKSQREPTRQGVHRA